VLALKDPLGKQVDHDLKEREKKKSKIGKARQRGTRGPSWNLSPGGEGRKRCGVVSRKGGLDSQNEI